MDARGYVTDYQVSGGTLVSTGDADSTDAYAGLFLLAVEAVQTAAPNGARLLALAPAVRLGVAAIRSTQRADGLTGAKPSWMVAYLMNEAEAFAGLQAATRLALVIGDRALARDGDTAAGAHPARGRSPVEPRDGCVRLGCAPERRATADELGPAVPGRDQPGVGRAIRARAGLPRRAVCSASCAPIRTRTTRQPST